MDEINVWGDGFYRHYRAKGYTLKIAASHLVAGIARVSMWKGRFDSIRAFRVRRATVCQLDDIPLRSTLTALLEGCDPDSRQWPRATVAHLTGHGLWLHNEGHHGPAGDVFDVVAESPYADSQARLFALQQRAFAARSEGRPFPAFLDYTLLYRRARGWADTRFALEAQLGLAFIACHREEFAEAEASFHEIAASAEQSDFGEVLGRAHHGLAYVCSQRGDMDGVLRHAAIAMPLILTKRGKDRLLEVVAEASRRKGMESDALRAAEWLSANASESAIRTEGAVIRRDALEPISGADAARLLTLRTALAEIVL